MGRENPLVGKKVVAFFVAEDNGALKFDLADGDPVIARCDGDCCSYTWVEHIEGADTLVGGTVVSVEDIDMPGDTDTPNSDGEYIAFYGCKITTDRGVCVIDYRNSSNGYYGGSLEWGDSYYGGVFGQKEWRDATAEPRP